MRWSGIDTPAWLLTHRADELNTATGIDVVTGFVAAMVLVGMRRRNTGLRQLDSYTAVRMLMRAGWRYSTTQPP